MDGIINILKPSGMTSFDVVSKIRNLAGTKKVGHAGTLDPDAVGVLVICIGRATKLMDFLVVKDKYYRAEMTLGVETDTQDSSGTVTRKTEALPNEDEIISAVQSFVGGYEQLPPMYSAIKVNGKKLYELARKGVEVERKKRFIDIFSIKTVNISKNRVLMDVHCSKGTYIRTLCHDIGDRLGCGGHMSFLLRTQVGKFNIENSHTLEYIEKHNMENIIIPMDEFLDEYPKNVLTSTEEKVFISGGLVEINKASDSEYFRVYSTEGKFISLAKRMENDTGNYIRTFKSFY